MRREAGIVVLNGQTHLKHPDVQIQAPRGDNDHCHPKIIKGSIISQFKSSSAAVSQSTFLLSLSNFKLQSSFGFRTTPNSHHAIHNHRNRIPCCPGLCSRSVQDFFFILWRNPLLLHWYSRRNLLQSQLRRVRRPLHPPS